MKGENELSEFLDEIDAALETAMNDHINGVGYTHEQKAAGIEQARNIILKMRLKRKDLFLKDIQHADQQGRY